jgi:hypothetical protein
VIGPALALWMAAAPAQAPAAAPAQAPAAASAQAPAAEVASAEPSRRAVRLGEPFDYALALRHAPEEQVELAPPPELAPFALRGSECRTTRGERSAATVCTLKLQLLDLGEREVPALQLRVRGPSGERIATAPGATVRGIGAEPGAAAEPLRRPPAPPVLVPSWRLAGLGAAALAAALAAWLLWRAWRRRAAPVAVALRPHERLSRRVGEILALELPRRGQGRDHMVRLSDAAREYLAAASPRAALDLTTAELLVELSTRRVAGVDREALGRFLGWADLVKYARHQPGPAECQAATGFSRDLVERTRPAPGGGAGGAEAA